MKIARKAAAVITMAALICTLLATAAFAAETGSLWVTVEQNEGTAALIVTDTVVTDGVVKLTYDSSKLTYESVEVTEDYVALYAVNAEEAGTVLISWVSPGEYTLKGDAVCLIRVNFSGVEENSTITLTGAAHNGSGSELTFADAPDTTKLEEAIAEAEALDAGKYTEESYGDVTEALADAKTVLAENTATQAEVDAAEKALRSAMDALVKVSGSTENTEESSESSTTKATEDSGDNANTGDNSNIWLFVVIAVLSAVAIIVLLIKMKPKKGGDAK